MYIVLTFIISLIALLWAANHVVIGATGIALRLNLSPFIVGTTIIALGTSFPEIIISIMSSFKNETDIALGNAIGANIANIGLVLGVANLIKPMSLNYSLMKRAYPLMLLTMIFAYGLILNGFLGRIDGCLFLLAFIATIAAFVYMESHQAVNDRVIKAFKSASFKQRTIKSSIFNLVLGFVILPLSGKFLIESTANMASWTGLSELTISLTIIALGTTIPELATAVVAAFKNEEDMAIGTILGSNVYNLLFIMAFPGIINPSAVNPHILSRDMPMMISLTILLIFLSFYYKNKLSRWHGGILLLIYFSYISAMILNASHS